MDPRPLRLGVAGLGRAFGLMLPTLERDPRIELVAAADPRPQARERFARDYRAAAYESVEALCADERVEVVYVATPHQMHAAHARLAAGHGKHLLVEKPMALTLEDCDAMTEAARRAGVQLVVGHSHSFDAPVQLARRIIESGEVGRVRMITAAYFTDFLYRPRRPEELDTAAGGGVLFNQAAHQVDVVRYLAGGLAATVRASTGAWDPARPTEGAYAAHLTFADSVFASLVYSGYAHFDGDELCCGIAESGLRKNPDAYGAARRSLAAQPEAALKQAESYGGERFAPLPVEGRLHQHFGMVIASCERADLRPLPDGVMVYGDTERRHVPLEPPRVPRATVIDELYAAVREGKPPVHDGAWATATLEVCLAMLRSAREAREITLERQVGLPAQR